MKKLYSALMLFLLQCSAFAQTSAAAGAPPADMESASPIVTYAFLIIFFGGIIGVGWYMYKGSKGDASDGNQKK